MKLNAFILFILITTVVANSACWSPKEVRASRSDGSTEPSTTPYTKSTPSTKNSSTENKNTTDIKPNNNESMAKKDGFKANLPASFQMPTDDVGLKLLTEYGSICLTSSGATPPNKIFFRDESEVSSFQSSLQMQSYFITP